MNCNSYTQEHKPSLILKVFLIGAKGVGKRTFMRSIASDTFDANTKLTIGVDFFTYDYPFRYKEENYFIRFSFWVCEPNPPFRKMFEYYLAGASAIYIMFDCSNLDSLKMIDNWMEKVNRYYRTEPSKILLGNKIDLISHPEKVGRIARSTVKKYQLEEYYEISAKYSINIIVPLKHIAERYIKVFNLRKKVYN